MSAMYAASGLARLAPPEAAGLLPMIEGSPRGHGAAGPVLMLTPSRGLGGGIERYAEAVESAFTVRGIGYQRLDLPAAGPVSHLRLLRQCSALLRAARAPHRLVLLHRSLLPAAWILVRSGHVSGVTVVMHGIDVWGDRPFIRRRFEQHEMRKSGVRAVAASSFTAGALARMCPAAVLPAGISREWFGLLTAAAAASRPCGGVNIVTAFRLGSWRDKGLPQLLEAISSLGRSDIHLTVCGTGKPPPELAEAVRSSPTSCRLLPGLSNQELANTLAAADLFVLATRTRVGRDPSGEGFGLVLLEAQVAGTPVVGPAYGGSGDAYIERVTGLTPRDESAAALAEVLDELLRDPQRLVQMGVSAGRWARENFAPERYAALAATKLL